MSVCISGCDRRQFAKVAGQVAKRMAHHIAQLGVKMDLGDKDFAFASDEFLLQAAKLAMGVLGGTAAHAVRKLGVDYAVPARGTRTRKVRAARFNSGKIRWCRLCKLGFKNQGARVVYARVFLHTTFGASMLQQRASYALSKACSVELG